MPFKDKTKNREYQRLWKKNKRAERSEDPKVQDQEVKPLEPNEVGEVLLNVLHTELNTLEAEAHPVEQKIRELGERIISLRQDLGLAGIQQQHLKKEMEPEEQVFRRRELQEKEEPLVLYEQKLAAKRDKIRRKSEEITNAERRVQHLQRAIANLEGTRNRTELEARDLREPGAAINQRGRTKDSTASSSHFQFEGRTKAPDRVA